MCFLFWAVSVNAEMAMPSASSPSLILMPSFMRSPCDIVFFSRSDPAKYTKCNLLEKLTSLKHYLIRYLT